MTGLADLKRKLMRNEEFAKAYEEADKRYRVVEDLIRLRVKAGLTVEQLSERMGVPLSVVLSIESGSVSSTAEYVDAYKKAVRL